MRIKKRTILDKKVEIKKSGPPGIKISRTKIPNIRNFKKVEVREFLIPRIDATLIFVKKS